jgi:hypothetical protein
MLRRFGAQHVALIVAVVTLAGLLLGFAGCQGLPKNVADCAVTPTPPADLTVVPPAPEPPAPALCGFPLTISSPTTGASVNSPVPLVATATRRIPFTQFECTSMARQFYTLPIPSSTN